MNANGKTEMFSKKQYLAFSGFLFIVTLIVAEGLDRLEQKVRQQTVSSLETALNSTYDSISQIWLKGLFEGATSLLADREIVGYIRQLLAANRTHAMLIKHPAQQEIRRYFKSHLTQQDALGMFIIAPDYTSVASMRDTNIGKTNLIAKTYPARLAKVFAGLPQFIPPIPSDVPLKNDQGHIVKHYPTMFYLVPIRDNTGHVIAILAIRLNPTHSFSRIAQSGRIGRSGETYLFNQQGYFISESRFTSTLEQSGLLHKGEGAILNLAVKNPGANITDANISRVDLKQQPLTHMAQRATTGEPGRSTQSYLDYRGVPVIGAWKWDEELGIGIATEIDEQEALEPYRNSQAIVVVMFATITLIGIVFFYLFSLFRKQTTAQLNHYSSELHRSETTLKKAQQIAHLGSWNWDIVTGDLAWSDEIYRIFGLEPQQFEATYDAFVEIIHPEDRETITTAVNTSLNNPDTPYNIEHRIVLPDGAIRYVHEQGEIERDMDGQAVHMIGIVHDITGIKTSHNAIKQAMLDLARNERVLRLALSGAGAGYWHLDLIAEELYWDELTLKMFGITAANFGGTFDDWAARVHEDDLENASKAFTQALEDKTANSFTLDYRIKKPDREVRYIHVTGQIDHNDSGQAASVYGLHFDITEDKLAEQKLHDARENAELANRAKSEFLAIMSHEIRTPMNAIIGMSNLVMNTELAPRQHNYLKKVVSSAETLLQIINDILDFSKIEAGQLQLENIDFKLDEVLNKLTHLVVLKAQEKGLEFLFSVSPKIPEHLQGDPTRLLQVLVNLASNAVKFTEQGEVVLRVEVDEDQGELVRIKFTVRDTGIGIEPKKQQHLFKSFSQADASITRKYGGTGLGLVIVKRMVKLMGGNIEFESEFGIGSSFYFTIPFGRSQSDQKTDNALPKDMENLRVLVVDDSESSRTILGETLAGFGFDVDVATTSHEAICAVETAEQHGKPYRLVLMDWKMPEQSGVEGARIILGQSKSALPPVVMMVTAYSADDMAEEIQNLAISSTLVKPVSPSSLLDAILNAFKQEELKQMDSSSPSYNPVNPAEELAGAHVLVVEDNELNMELALELLQDAGVLTDSASNGQQALQMLEQKTFDGVLMDVHMPVMDGLEATRIIRQQEQYQSLPIIALTADTLDDDREDILATGMNDLIVKPIKVDLMLETMAKWIRPASSNNMHASVINSKDMDMSLSIPGIDTRAGLETCNGKLSLYQKLLKKFINEAEFIEQFKDAMKKGDRDLAERLAHTLKGTAGNIGATGIQQAAKVLQDAFRENATDKMINQLYKKVEQELIPVIQVLGKTEFEDKAANKVNADTLDITTLMPILDELGNLLADDDTDATEKIGQIYNDLKNSPFEEHINEIAKHVGRYEFKDALEQLHTLTARMKASN